MCLIVVAIFLVGRQSFRVFNSTIPPEQEEYISFDKQKAEQVLLDIDKLIEKTEEYKRISELTGWTMELARHFVIECELRNVDKFKALAVCQLESKFKFDAINYNTNNTKDIGVFQINDVTYSSIVKALKIEGRQFDSWDRTNPYFGITAGIYWLSYLQNTYNYENNHELLTAYNRGHGGMLKLTARSGSAISTYSKKVIQISEELK